MNSKCGKNKNVAHEAQPSVSLMFLPHFDVLCDLLLNSARSFQFLRFIREVAPFLLWKGWRVWCCNLSFVNEHNGDIF